MDSFRPVAAAPFDATSQYWVVSAVLPRPLLPLAQFAQAVVQSASLPILPTAPRRTPAIRAAPPPGAARTNRAVAPPFPAFAQMAENAGRLRNNHHRRGPGALHRVNDHAWHQQPSDQGRSGGPADLRSAYL